MDAGDSVLSGVLLKVLEERGRFDSYELSKELDKDHQYVVGVIKSLQSVGSVSFLVAT